MPSANYLPSVWIGCLAAYNQGILHGDWVVVGDGMNVIEDQIQRILAESPVEDSEEWFLGDTDNLPYMGEFPSLEKMDDVGEFIKMNSDIYPPAVLLKVLEFTAIDLELANELIEECMGIYPNFREFSDSIADEIVFSELPNCYRNNSVLTQYFDYESFANDLAHDYHVIDVPGGVFIVHSSV